jgi:hypothetical protein
MSCRSRRSTRLRGIERFRSRTSLAVPVPATAWLPRLVLLLFLEDLRFLIVEGESAGGSAGEI